MNIAKQKQTQVQRTDVVTSEEKEGREGTEVGYEKYKLVCNTVQEVVIKITPNKKEIQKDCLRKPYK